MVAAWTGAEEREGREHIWGAGESLNQQGLLVLWVWDTRKEEDTQMTTSFSPEQLS